MLMDMFERRAQLTPAPSMRQSSYLDGFEARMTTPEYRWPLGNSLVIWTTILLLYTSVFVAMRTWGRWQQQWSWADGVFLTGYVSRVRHRNPTPRF